MKYYVNDEEVSFAVFKTAFKTCMEMIYGKFWLNSQADDHSEYAITNMHLTGQQLCINHVCFTIRKEGF